MAARYERAARRTAPRAAVLEASGSVEGWWLDDKRYGFLQERFDPEQGRVLALPAVADMAAGEVRPLIPEDQLRAIVSGALGREVSLGELGLAAFDFGSAGRLGVELGEDALEIDVASSQVLSSRRRLGEPALYSPDGRMAVVVRGHDLWVLDLEPGEAHPLLTGGEAGWAFGRQSETSRMTLADRRRPSPLGLWSRDSAWFLTHRIDERRLREIALLEHVPPGRAPPVNHAIKYPLPGDEIPSAAFVAVEVASGRSVTFADCPFPVALDTPFLRKMCWFGGARTAWALRQERFARTAELVRLDLVAGTAEVVIREEVSDGFIDLSSTPLRPPNVRTLDETGEIVWVSEREGYARLYLHDAAGRLRRPVTPKGVVVRDLVHVDEAGRRLVFLASGLDADADPARRTLCRIGLGGEEMEVLAACEGDVGVAATEPTGPGQTRRLASTGLAGVSAGGDRVVVRRGCLRDGDETVAIDHATGTSIVLARSAPSPDAPPVHQVRLLAADGRTTLFGALYLPTRFEPSGRYALVDFIYPGPQVAQQPQAYASANGALARTLAELGFAVLLLDSRGVAVGDRVFRQASYGRLLEPQLMDHAAAVRQLCAETPWLDPERVGVLGHSAGGAAAFRALCDYGDVYRVAVSVCGNHDSDLLSAAWSDKYRGPRPPEGWAYPSNVEVAHRCTGALLLAHGDLDETVHLSQSLQLADALIAANRDFELLVAPGAGHDVLFTSGYVQRRIWDFLVERLIGARPPDRFDLRFQPHELARLAAVAKRESRL